MYPDAMTRISAWFRLLIPLYLLVLVQVHPTCAQEVTVQASVNSTVVGTQEVVTFTLSVQGSDGSDVQPPGAPESKGLALAQSTPGTQRNVSIINGRVSQSFGYTWAFRPIGEGQARIEAMTVTVGDRTYHTEPIDIQVVPQSDRPARPQRRDPFASPFSPSDPEPEPEPPSDRDIFIRATPASATVWQGQQLVIQYRLFFRDGIQLRQSRLTDSWEAEGFWREEMDVETRPIPQTVVQNGLRYNVITLKQAAVFPARAGDLSVDPLRIESEAMLPAGRRDPFQSLFSMRSRYSPVELASGTVRVTARPLPDGAPSSFQGVVGNFTMTARTDRQQVEVGSSIRLSVTLRGDGNLATLAAPRIQAPAVFETYEPQSTLDVDRSGNRLTGSKTFTYVLIPRANGVFEIPPVEFSWFDPDANSYRTTQSNAVPVTVTGTARVPDVVSATTNGLPVDDVAPPFVEATNWTQASPTPLHSRSLTWILLMVPVLVYGLGRGVDIRRRRQSANPSAARGRRAHPLSRHHLKRATELMHTPDTAGFFEELDRAVLGFVGNRLDIPERGLTRARLDEILVERGVPSGTRTRLLHFLDTCDMGIYAPSAMDHDRREQALDDASALIPDLDEHFST